MSFNPGLVAKALTVLAAGLSAAVAAGLLVGPYAALATILVTALTSVAVYLVPNSRPAGAAQPQPAEAPAPVVVVPVPPAVTPPV